MKRLLLPLLAALALPTSVNAEQTLLIMEFGVEMNGLEECKREGDRWLASSGVSVKGQKARLSYQCKEVD